jgi:cell division septation protein DedD
VLGILVGRGFLPGEVKTLRELKAQIVKLQDMVGSKKTAKPDLLKDSQKEPEFAFYDELSAKRSERTRPVKPTTKAPAPSIDGTATGKGNAAREKIGIHVKPEGKKNSRMPPAKGLDNPAEKDQKAETTVTDTGYTVQLASLESGIQAVKLVDGLVDRGYPAYFYKIKIKGKLFYRVRCGKFKRKKDAVDLMERLARTQKIKGFVTEIEK